MSEIKYVTLKGETRELTWDELFQAVSRIRAFFRAVNTRFIEREDLVNRIMCATLLREHVLVIGPTGAAKSALIDTIMHGVVGAKVWSMDLTKFTIVS